MTLTLPAFLTPRAPKKDEVPQFLAGTYRLNFLHLYILLAPVVLILIGLKFVPFLPYTALWAGFCFCYAGLGITAGYHRLFSHCAYRASTIYQLVMACCGAGALQGSIKWWSRNHRIHHRYVDTDKDPYNALRGFWFTHLGWLIMQQNYDILGRVNVSDLSASKIVVWQHRYYGLLALIFGILIPALVPGLFWGDWAGGLCYAVGLKIFIVHHSTFFINSIAHFPLPRFLGSLQTYSDGHTTFDNWLVSILTNGEGYHNFHHEFPNDYRNGVRLWQWDPTKWLIRVAYVLGFVRDLRRHPGKEITKARLLQRYYTHTADAASVLDRLERIDHGPQIEALPVVSRADVAQTAREGGSLMIIDGIVYNYKLHVHTGSGCTHRDKATSWYDNHPGGRRYLDLYAGKDATSAFKGGVYQHTLFAEQMLQSLAVARVVEPLEESPILREVADTM